MYALLDNTLVSNCTVDCRLPVILVQRISSWDDLPQMFVHCSKDANSSERRSTQQLHGSLKPNANHVLCYLIPGMGQLFADIGYFVGFAVIGPRQCHPEGVHDGNPLGLGGIMIFLLNFLYSHAIESLHKGTIQGQLLCVPWIPGDTIVTVFRPCCRGGLKDANCSRNSLDCGHELLHRSSINVQTGYP